MKLSLKACLTLGTLLSATPSASATFLEIISEYFDPLPETAVSNPNDATTKAQIELGKTLYFDPRLSADWDVSCASCHDINNGGDDGLEVSVGHQGLTGERNAPTVLNAVFNIAQFWDGRADTLAEQAKGPVIAPVEMANTPENVIKTLNAIPWYREQFNAAFPNQGDALTFDNMAAAIATFEETLVTPTKFDDFLNGDESALTPDELFGVFTFIDTGCIVCHNGTNVGGGFFERLGMVHAVDPAKFPPEDTGVYAVTNLEEDRYSFRVAPLRNVTVTAPYFHSGRVDTLEEAVNIMAKAQLGTVLRPQDTASIIAFLTSLEGAPLGIDAPELPELDPELAHTVAPPALAHLYPDPQEAIVNDEVEDTTLTGVLVETIEAVEAEAPDSEPTSQPKPVEVSPAKPAETTQKSKPPKSTSSFTSVADLD